MERLIYHMLACSCFVPCDERHPTVLQKEHYHCVLQKSYMFTPRLWEHRIPRPATLSAASVSHCCLSSDPVCTGPITVHFLYCMPSFRTSLSESVRNDEGVSKIPHHHCTRWKRHIFRACGFHLRCIRTLPWSPATPSPYSLRPRYIIGDDNVFLCISVLKLQYAYTGEPMMKRTPFFMAILSFLLVLSRTQADRSDTTTLLIKSQISKNQARLHPLSRISHSKLKLKRAFTLRSGDVGGVQVRAGLTGDECSPDQGCVGSRECTDGEGEENFPCSNESDNCLCNPEEGFQSCEYSYECVEGELCASIRKGSPFCLSKAFVANNTATVQTDGFTLDECEASSQCIAPRICEFKLDNDEFKECNYNRDELCNCFATLPTECEADADCPDRAEICAERTDLEIGMFLCISKDSVRRLSFWRPAPTSAISSPTPTSATGLPSTNPVGTVPPQWDCIDVRALSHLSEEDLVFKTHFVAPVLCDSNDSCATPAHVVMHDRRPMMMRSYCATVGCTKKNMYVNSPKYYRRLVVKSKTPGLHFTVFAARYGTRLEEVVISSVLRLGF
ncbi:hypothetical protein CHC_T00008993001 [Chondrus crispus]|uniref:Uncharacterized protein n=1 Tax=Chondrus crispus TaxID=2769 RepID=R7Q5N6_CHOCR|nr:hypothetical protein CHC_T00008993001 [Chondrus crispus]CDF33148.1 hypothetical protein CHC_T00008993001 [Chondrus crispus]|eukprot:XP_005712951.1 hypothetical protein CHC_T00008993001 [Chondrus crispus]